MEAVMAEEKVEEKVGVDQATGVAVSRVRRLVVPQAAPVHMEGTYRSSWSSPPSHSGHR